MTSASTSNIDLQSWWEVPSIAHFCSLFRVAFNLLDFDIEELEEALLTDGTELNGSSLLQELIVRLLSGCLGHNGISTSNYQMFLRRLFRTKCKEQSRENPFNTDIDFQFLPLRTKVEILHVLCDFRLDADDVIDVLKNLDSDSLRVHPLGYDDNKSAYWYFYGTRLYREDYPKVRVDSMQQRKRKRDNDKQKTKRKRKDDSSSDDGQPEEEETGWPPALGSWQVMCYTEDDWRKLAQSIAHSMCKEERALYQVLSEDFLPEIPRLFEEKERLQRKRLLENQPRRQSQRIEKLKSQKEPMMTSPPTSKTRQERDKERRKRIKGRADKERRRRLMSGTNSESESSLTSVLPSGRQTNNSLASATGEIYIKPQNAQKLRNTLFKRTHEDLMTGLYKILDRVKAHDDAWPFRAPVDEKFAPRYYAVIARPMDLQSMEDKLDNAEYGSLADFRADFQLIVDNCRQYNGSGNEYTGMAKQLQALFEACAERFFEAEPSSDEGCPLLRRAFPDQSGGAGEDDNDSVGSSFTPDDRPPSIRSGWSRSQSSLSGASIIMSDDANSSSSSVNYAAASGRRPRHRSRQRRRRKDRHGAPRAGTDTTSSNSNSRPPPHRRDVSVLSCEESSDRGKDKVKPPLTSRRPILDAVKDKPALAANDDEAERSRPKINYKEDDTSESEVLSESSDDSFAASHKLKIKGGIVKKAVCRAGVIKNVELVEELELVTTEVLRDITRMLEDSPRFSDFSSNSNSPFHSPSYVVEEIATMEGELRRRLSSHNRPRDRFSNEVHRRRMYKEQLGMKRKREIQRTIDRLQPGKSKGNLLCKEKARGVEEGGEGGETKSAEGADVGAPQISLGKVLETSVMGFGIGEPALVMKDSAGREQVESNSDEFPSSTEVKEEKADNRPTEVDEEVDKKPMQEDVPVKADEAVQKKKGKPTPNLSAWFKAFGAPKPSNGPKKKVDVEEGKTEWSRPKEDELVEGDKKTLSSELLPARRQRKTSTGSSVSERSSFSQEPQDGNSPRPSLDEPYQSPQQEVRPYHHSPINGTIKVGFYQDTCFPRGSSDKSGSSPRDLPSGSPRTPYCSPRNTPVGSREYQAGSPRTPYSRTMVMSPRDYPGSPRTEYNADIILRREYQPRDYPNPREYISPASPREYRRDYPPTPPTPRDYRDAISPQYPSPTTEVRGVPEPRVIDQPRTDYQAFEPPRSPSAPMYAGVPSYPSHLYFEANKQAAEFRANLDKPSPPVYPVKKRAYNEAANASPKHDVYKGGGGSFTPTKGAMEQERTFTPTPGRLPGPSTTPSLPIGLPHHPLQQHLIDQYAEEERRIVSPFYPTEYAKPATQFGPQFISRSLTPSSQSPINYSNAPTVKSPSPPPPNDLHGHGIVSTSSSAAMVFASGRLEDLLQDKVSSQFRTELPHFSSAQDLPKLPPHQSNLQRYTQMTNLGYNYHQMIQGKGPPVYNHPMQELMQSKAAAAVQFGIPSPYGRPIGEKEREVPFIPRPPSSSQQTKPTEKPPKKNRKKKNEAAVAAAGYHQYGGGADVPSSAFNYGPPAASAPLKDTYGPGPGSTPFLDQSTYYDGSNAPMQTSEAKPPPPPFFLGRGGTGTGGYSPHHPFISQAQYQEYLLHHGVLPPTPGYPSPAYLGLHSPMNRPSWL